MGERMSGINQYVKQVINAWGLKKKRRWAWMVLGPRKMSTFKRWSSYAWPKPKRDLADWLKIGSLPFEPHFLKIGEIANSIMTVDLLLAINTFTLLQINLSDSSFLLLSSKLLLSWATSSNPTLLWGLFWTSKTSLVSTQLHVHFIYIYGLP